MSQTPFEKQKIEEFREKVKELKESDYKNETIVYFGYRHTDYTGEIFTVTDFGNIEKFLQTALREQREMIENVKNTEWDPLPEYGGLINFASNTDPHVNDLGDAMSQGFKYGFRLGWQTHFYEVESLNKSLTPQELEVKPETNE